MMDIIATVEWAVIMIETGIYYIDGKIVERSGDVVVYEMDNEFYLEIGPGHTLWTISSELSDYMEQLADKPLGNVLEIGLGLGIASRYILSCEKVKSLTTIEINKDIIKVYNKIKNIVDDKVSEKVLLTSDKKHRIINHDGLRYITHTQKKYDFIFIDNYTLIDEETLPEIEELVYEGKKLLNKGGKIMGWFDKFTPEKHVDWFNEVFEYNRVAEN